MVLGYSSGDKLIWFKRVAKMLLEKQSRYKLQMGHRVERNALIPDAYSLWSPKGWNL